MIPELNTDYWHQRWLEGETGWDIGGVSSPLKEYFDQLSDKKIKILIPGCGNAYEAEYLHKKGFTNVYIIDLSYAPLKNLKKRVPDFPSEHLLTGDFFTLSNLSFDLIIEQTFFCAINPELRKNYAKQSHKLLNPNGKLVGLLFNDTLNTDHPPFGGNKEEYKKYFSPYFNFKVFETCYNSIKSRQNRELFILFEKKRMRFYKRIKMRYIVCIFFLSVISLHLFSQTDTNNLYKQFHIEYSLDSNDIRYFYQMGLQIDSCSYSPLYHEMCLWTGTSYHYAGNSEKGIDCSGLVKSIFYKIYNLSLSGGSANLFLLTNPVEKTNLQEGDLVFFKIAKSRISHVGIYLSNNKFIHASVKLGVIVSDLDEPYYQKYFYKAGRLP